VLISYAPPGWPEHAISVRCSSGSGRDPDPVLADVDDARTGRFESMRAACVTYAHFALELVAVAVVDVGQNGVGVAPLPLEQRTENRRVHGQPGGA